MGKHQNTDIIKCPWDFSTLDSTEEKITRQAFLHLVYDKGTVQTKSLMTFNCTKKHLRCRKLLETRDTTQTLKVGQPRHLSIIPASDHAHWS